MEASEGHDQSARASMREPIGKEREASSWQGGGQAESKRKQTGRWAWSDADINRDLELTLGLGMGLGLRLQLELVSSSSAKRSRQNRQRSYTMAANSMEARRAQKLYVIALALGRHSSSNSRHSRSGSHNRYETNQARPKLHTHTQAHTHTQPNARTSLPALSGTLSISSMVTASKILLPLNGRSGAAAAHCSPRFVVFFVSCLVMCTRRHCCYTTKYRRLSEKQNIYYIFL